MIKTGQVLALWSLTLLGCIAEDVTVPAPAAGKDETQHDRAGDDDRPAAEDLDLDVSGERTDYISGMDGKRSGTSAATARSRCAGSRTTPAARCVRPRPGAGTTAPGWSW